MNANITGAIAAATEQHVEVDGPIIQEGDFVIVLKQDGSVANYTIGVSAGGLSEKLEAGKPLSPKERRILDLGRKMLILTMAAQSEEIMSALMDALMASEGTHEAEGSVN